jgi:hypothetical protein
MTRRYALLVAGPKANDELYFALKGTVHNLHRIGDCVALRKLDHAIYEGELERWEEATVGATV